MTNDMTQGKPFKLFIWFSIPLLIGNVFQQLYSMVDTIIVGKFLGEEALAAVGSTGSMFFLVNGFLLGLTSGFSVMVAQRFGAKDEDSVKKAIASNITLTVILTIVVTIVMLALKTPLLKLMNTPENVFGYADTYITIIYAGIFTQSFYNMSAGILRALGDSKTPLYFLILASVVNIVLDLVFIVNFDMGVAGAAHATNIAQGLAAILCLVYSYKKFHLLKLKKEDFKVPASYYRTHFCIGLPMALQFSITAIGIMTLQSAINIFGSSVMAAYIAASKVIQLVMQPLVTYGVSTATFVGQNLGAGLYHRIREGVKTITFISIITSILSSSVLLLFGKSLIGLFLENPSQEVIGYASQVLNYAAAFFIPLGLIFVYRNALQGMGESFIPMMAGVFELVARAVVAYTLPAVIGFVGICLADPAAWIAAAVPLVIVYFMKMRKIEQEMDKEDEIRI
ncbi:MATE family efflux transporter [Niameybacter massiliensis]|uniref:MATE family efflux transporter n=1 Tax=Niameybacter massiliensis TaxID=1658108 RepID=UPI0006B64A58|nr:MATE family efflux transporter [Niameybacter massiliensis]